MEGYFIIYSYSSKLFTNFTKPNFNSVIKFPLKHLTNFNQAIASYFIINSILTYYQTLIMDIIHFNLDIMDLFTNLDIMDFKSLIMDFKSLIINSSFLIIVNLKMHYSILTQLGSYFTYFTSFLVIAQFIKHFPILPFMANSLRHIIT